MTPNLIMTPNLMMIDDSSSSKKKTILFDIPTEKLISPQPSSCQVAHVIAGHTPEKFATKKLRISIGWMIALYIVIIPPSLMFFLALSLGTFCFLVRLLHIYQR